MINFYLEQMEPLINGTIAHKTSFRMRDAWMQIGIRFHKESDWELPQ